jgi:septum formation protein
MRYREKIVLASASPRRRQLLRELGLEFEIRPSDINEDAWPGETPLETQKRVTMDKASAVARAQGEWVIACDTTVLLDGEMLNKPADAAEAWDMLRRLRGREHQVQSVIVLLGDERADMDVVVSTVRMRSYTDEEIAVYIASGDPFDKAGSYAVQHPVFQPVAEISGCPLNVIGLSLCALRARFDDPDGFGKCGSVCEAWFGVPCPAVRNDPEHRVPGARTQP